MELTEEDLGGRPESCSPVQSIARNPKKVSYPALCQKCTGQFYTQEDGPDAGERFACGIMLENMEAGCMYFSCPYFKPVPCAAIIDAESLQAHARIITGPESPHEFIDPLMDGSRYVRKERELTAREELASIISDLEFEQKVLAERIRAVSEGVL